MYLSWKWFFIHFILGWKKEPHSLKTSQKLLRFLKDLQQVNHKHCFLCYLIWHIKLRRELFPNPDNKQYIQWLAAEAEHSDLSFSSLLFFGTSSHHAHRRITIWFLCMFLPVCFWSFVYPLSMLSIQLLSFPWQSWWFQLDTGHLTSGEWQIPEGTQIVPPKISLVHVNNKPHSE